MPPATAASPECAACEAFVRLKGLAMLLLGTGATFAVLRKPLALPWSALFSLAVASLPSYAVTRRQLKKCVDLWDLQPPRPPEVAPGEQ
ncbi:transmembrane protein 141 [Liasis olivaceus]